MANRILIEIDVNEARVVLARGSSRTWEFADSFSVEIGEGATDETIARLVKQSLTQRSIPVRGDLDLIVSRRDIELRELEMPPAPDDELPEMVRFAARGEFTHFADGTMLDFVSIQGDQDSQRKVLAATLNLPAANLADRLSSELNLKVKRILIRPWCLAQALATSIEADKLTLVVDQPGNVVEMSLWFDGHLLVTRSFRPGAHEPEQRQEEIADEIQRTLLATPRSTGGLSAGKVVVVGTREDFPIPSRKSFPELHYVIPGANRGGDSRNGGRGLIFAAHRGAINYLVKSDGDMPDFKNPRRSKSKQWDVKRTAIWGGVAAASLVGCILFAWSMLSSQARTLKSLEARLNTIKEANAPGNNRPGIEQIVGEVELVDNWVANRVDWMTEIKEISDRMLTPDDAIVDSIMLTAVDTKAQIILEGHVLNSETGTDVKSQLNLRPYQFLEMGASRTDSKMPDYPVSFKYVFQHVLDGQAAISAVSDRARETGPKSSVESDASQPADGDGIGSTSSGSGKTE